MNIVGIEEEVREKTANLTLELQKKQTEIEQLSKQLEASSYELSTVVAEKEIQKKLEKDAEANARLIDDLNSEGISACIVSLAEVL